jgi:CheY-like chemotaxis protein
MKDTDDVQAVPGDGPGRDAEPAADLVVAAVGDLIFGARIRAAAEQGGVRLRLARTIDELCSAAAGARLVLIDLDARWLDGADAVSRLRAAPQTAAVHIVAFVSHVRIDAIEAARAAGADRVLARSAFVKELHTLLGRR